MLNKVEVTPWISAGLVCAIAMPSCSGDGPSKLVKLAVRCAVNSTDMPAEAKSLQH